MLTAHEVADLVWYECSDVDVVLIPEVDGLVLRLDFGASRLSRKYALGFLEDAHPRVVKAAITEQARAIALARRTRTAEANHDGN